MELQFKTVVVIGCGGIGSHLLPSLIRFLASVEAAKRPKVIKLVDGDKYTESNATRQDFVERFMNTNKASAQAYRYDKLFSGTMQFVSVEDYVGASNVAAIIEESSVVFLGVDNHVCRKVVTQHCQKLNNVLLISGGNELTDGNVQAYLRIDGKEMLPPIEKRHPEMLTTKDGDRSAMSCAEIEKLPSGGQIIFTNCMAATLMCQLFWAICVKRKFNVQEIYFDILALKTRTVDHNESQKQA